MSYRPFSLLLILVATATTTAPSAWAAPADPEAAARTFTLKVLPVLKDKCFACHGEDPEKIKGGLNMLTREGLLKGGEESGDKVLIPGDAGSSHLYVAVTWENPDMEMPPKENDRLNPAQIEVIRDWIDAGAPWPDQEAQKKHQESEWSVASNEQGVLVKTSGGQTDLWTYRRYRPEDIWAFQPLSKPELNMESGGNPIDHFINRRLADEGLAPAPPADARTLIRRIWYDLTGLPPSPAEMDRWLSHFSAMEIASAKTQSVYRRKVVAELVDELLASPRYGEHWGQHWLDVVRYADTSGFSNDYERANAWRFRDYVIRSINADKPWDRFITEQLAGDELSPDNPEMIVAAGFLRMGPYEHTPMNPFMVSRQSWLDDTVNITGQAFLSTTMRCFKCHDHKFDPLPTRDYYRFYAAFAATQPVERPAGFLPAEDRAAFPEDREGVQARLDFAQQHLRTLLDKQEAKAKEWYAERNLPYLDEKARGGQPDGSKPPRFFGLTTSEEGQIKVREQDIRIWTRAMERYQPLAQSVYNAGDLPQNSDKLRMADPAKKQEAARAEEVPSAFILAGGSINSPKDAVSPGVLSVLGLPSPDGSGDDPWALPEGMEKRRLALANWITRPDNPLTTRSIVNRVWGWHFGQAIAAAPNNFGKTGKLPSHPGLLDWLAVRFTENGWSLKQFHRLIMTSDVYLRASSHPDAKSLANKDPDNHLLAVFTPRRLSAEELRDSLLAVTGELDLTMGGLPSRPEINFEVAMAPRMIQFSIAPAYQASRTPAGRNRRSIYALRVRGLADPMMEVFNKPGSDDSCERRDTTSVTPQVFTMLNSDVITNRSIAFAHRLETEESETAARITRAFRLVFNRDPGPSEQKKLLTHFEQMTAYHRAHHPDPVSYPVEITRSLVEEFSGEPFEYTELLDSYRNYLPDLQAASVSPETRALADICLILFNSNEFAFVY